MSQGPVQYDDSDEIKEMNTNAGAARRFREFDCPDCNANNPVEATIGEGDECLCNYCGNEYKVKVTDEGRLKLKQM